MIVNVTYRHKMRGLRMRISRTCEVNVSAPVGTPRKRIEQFVDDNREWICRAIARVQASVKREDAFYARLPLESSQQCEEARERLNALIMPLVEKYSRQMNVWPAHITYKAMRTRWGSCNKASRRINFSTYLLLLPEWCVEHVVVHELAHLHEPNHGPRFYALMDEHFPRWHEARKETRRICRMGSDED